MRVAMCALMTVLLAGCSGAAAVTPTPTRTPVPTATATVEPVASTPILTELVVAAVDAAFDEALRYVLERDTATVTADQLTAAVLSVVRQLAEGDRSPALLDACSVVAGGAAARASETGASLLNELATACAAGDEARLVSAVNAVVAAIGQ